jgi:SLT domain-containing protein
MPALRYDLIADPRRFNKGFDQAEKRASGFGKAMSRIGGATAGLFAGGAIVAGVKKVADAGSDLNETVNKTGLAFGRNAGAIQAWAQGSAKSMGLPKQAALEGASSFGLLLSKIGVGAGQTAKMSTAMVQLAVDLGSVHNADPTQIIEAQTAAFRGEYDSLQQFVPAINAAAVEQEALAQTHKRSAKELTDAEKAQAVYSIMLKQTTAEQGDFARTADESANKTKINAARVKDLQANIGTALLPALNAGANALGTMGNWIERNQGAAKVLGGAIVALTGFVLAMSAASKVAAATQAAVRGATLAWAVAQRVLNLALAMNPIGLVITAIALLVAGIILAYKRSETFRKIVDTAFAGIKTAVLSAVGFIITSFRLWWNVATTVVAGILHLFGKLPGPMGAPFRKAEEAVRRAKATVNTQLDAIQRRVNQLRGKNIPITADAKVTVAKSTTEFLRTFHVKAPQLAGGGPAPPGGRGPTADDRLAWLSTGEHVWAAREVAAAGGHAAMERWRNAVLRGEVPGFATGGALTGRNLGRVRAADIAATRTMGQRLAGGMAGALGPAIARAIDKAAAAQGVSAGGGGGTATGATGSVNQIAQRTASLLRRAGEWMSWARRIMFESGGNWRAINRWDSNWAAGHPSVGGAQVIRGTFARWAGPYRNVGPFAYGVSMNPLANSYAGANYAVHRYGSLRAVDPRVRPRGYDTGGVLPPGLSLSWNGTGRPEPLVPAGGTRPISVTVPVTIIGGGVTAAQRAEMEKAAERLGETLAAELSDALARRGSGV